jgi:hypothetical protein
MENTKSVLFENDEAVWFVAIANQPVGPLKPSQVYQKVLAQEIVVGSFVWRDGMKDWARLSDQEEFKNLFPSKPPPIVLEQAQKKMAKAPPPPPKETVEIIEERNWFLIHNDVQIGPFSTTEVIASLQSGKVFPRDHAWQDGMSNWVKIQDLSDFAEYFSSHPKVIESKRGAPTPAASSSEKRQSNRKALVARVLLTDENTLFMGMCRDISIGGMQILTDRLPGPAGTRVRLNISPTDKNSNVPAFVAEGVVVRILEDNRGFSFRFDKISAAAKKAIEEYLALHD